MKSNKREKIRYAIVSFATVVIPVMADALRDYIDVMYSRSFMFPLGRFMLAIFVPAVLAVLIFIKVMIQRNMPVRFSRLINVATVGVFILGIVFFYKPVGLLQTILVYPITMLIACFQLCSLAYDLFFQRSFAEQPGENESD